MPFLSRITRKELKSQRLLWKGREVKSIEWSNGATETSIPFTKDLSPLGAKITVIKDKKELTLECPAVDFPEEEKTEEKPELKVEVTDTTKTHRTFKSIITGEREGWTIVWFKRGDGLKNLLRSLVFE